MNNIIRHDPFRSLFTFPRFIDDIDEAVAPRGLKIRETDKDIIAEAVVAGVPASDVEVHIEDGVLTIKAQASEETKNKSEQHSAWYQYYYTAALSGGQWDKAEATVRNGVVIITVPKAEAARPRKIEVKSKG